jgi:futalosine hydrolase
MKRTLMVFPTLLEATDILDEFTKGNKENFYTHNKSPNIQLLLTGAGIPNTCFALGKIFDNTYDFVFQFGICGSFHEHITTGSVVRVTEDVFGEMGAEENGRFIMADDLNIGIQTAFHEKSTHALPDFLEKIPKAKGLTVGTLYAYGPSYDLRRQRFPLADVESMEGAAFFMCNQHRPNVFQIRAISNHAGIRDKSQWNISLALQNLHEITRQIIKVYGN